MSTEDQTKDKTKGLPIIVWPLNKKIFGGAFVSTTLIFAAYLASQYFIDEDGNFKNPFEADEQKESVEVKPETARKNIVVV